MTAARASSEDAYGAPRPVTVVGLGADGWEGLTGPARAAIVSAGVVVGGPRQLDLLPAHVRAERVSWPKPLRPSVGRFVAEYASAGLVVLASGDPMHYGIGRALAEEVGAARLVVHPHPSSMSLACARLGWAVEDVTVVSVVGRDVAGVAAALHDGARVLVLSSGPRSPRAVADLLVASGFGSSRLTVLADLGSPDESRHEGSARSWPDVTVPALNIVAVDCRRDAGATRLGLTAGLPDHAYDHDGQLTKRQVRAVTLATLAPEPGETLWDIGGGSGSIGIEWMRAHPTCRAVTVEPRADRAARIAANAARLGVPGLRVVTDRAPQALSRIEAADAPDAIFVGGGLTAPGLLDECWAALADGGRLVANTVTLESEAVLLAARARYGGELVRLEVSRAGAVGSFTSWSPSRPVTQWSVTKHTEQAEPAPSESHHAAVSDYAVQAVEATAVTSASQEDSP